MTGRLTIQKCRDLNLFAAVFSNASNHIKYGETKTGHPCEYCRAMEDIIYMRVARVTFSLSFICKWCLQSLFNDITWQRFYCKMAIVKMIRLIDVDSARHIWQIYKFISI